MYVYSYTICVYEYILYNIYTCMYILTRCMFINIYIYTFIFPELYDSEESFAAYIAFNKVLINISKRLSFLFPPFYDLEEWIFPTVI